MRYILHQTECQLVFIPRIHRPIWNIVVSTHEHTAWSRGKIIAQLCRRVRHIVMRIERHNVQIIVYIHKIWADCGKVFGRRICVTQFGINLSPYKRFPRRICRQAVYKFKRICAPIVCNCRPNAQRCGQCRLVRFVPVV